MALVSITQAAKLAGLARSQLYSQYIKRGVISVTRDSRGKPVIDTAELMRVFGAIRLPDLETVGQDTSPPLRTEQDSSTIIEMLKAQLHEANVREAEAKEREQFYQQQIAELTHTMKRLEYKPTDRPRRWWQWWP